MSIPRSDIEIQTHERRLLVTGVSANALRDALQPSPRLRTFDAFDDDADLLFCGCYVYRDADEALTVIYARRDRISNAVLAAPPRRRKTRRGA